MGLDGPKCPADGDDSPAVVASNAVITPERHPQAAQKKEGKKQLKFATNEKKLKVLYLYAGERRKASIAAWLVKLAKGGRYVVEVEEVDITLDPATMDLEDGALQQQY